VSLFLAAVVAGLLIGWLRGGSLASLGSARVRALWLVLPAFAVEFYLALGLGRDVPWWVLPLHVGANALLLGVALLNRRVPGMAVLALGLALNLAVIASNGGLMPVSPELWAARHAAERVAIGQHPPQTKDVVLPHDQARLWFLGDVLALPAGAPVPLIASAGDLVIAVGLVIALQGLMQAGRPVPRRRRRGGRVWQVSGLI